MKNITLTIVLATLLAACSSGTTVSDSPQNVTSRFQGTFKNTIGTESGTVIIDLIEDAGGGLVGNIFFTPSGRSCLNNSTVTGSTTGFNLVLSAAQSGELYTITTTVTSSGGSVDTTITTSPTGTVGTVTTTDSNGAVTTVKTELENLSGTLNMQFSINNNGSNLDGTYIVSGSGSSGSGTSSASTCSSSEGSGTMNLNG